MISFSAKQGFAASKCKVVYFKHNDPEDLEARIQEFNEKVKLWIFEYSMDIRYLYK